MTKHVQNLFELVPRQKRPCEELADGTFIVTLTFKQGSMLRRAIWLVDTKAQSVDPDNNAAAALMVEQ